MTWALKIRNNENRDDFDVLHRSIESAFSDFFELKPTGLFDEEWIPSIDIGEDKKHVTVKVEIPGIERDDLHLVIEGDVLTISGEKKEEHTEKDENKRLVMSERRFGSFKRSITFPRGTDTEKISAQFKNGILTVDIPKTEIAEDKRIQIEVK